jgi:hypothetical protein
MPLDISSLSLLVFIDASFANNKDLLLQIGFVIALTNRNLLEWSKARCLISLFYSADTTIYRCS